MPAPVCLAKKTDTQAKTCENKFWSYNLDYEKQGTVGKFLKSPNHIFVIINILLFLITDLFTPNDVGLGIIEKYGNYWPYVIYGHEYYRLLTCTFLHFSIQHIIGNMLMIFLLGDVLEEAFGKVRYTILYLSTGILSSAVSLFYNYRTMSSSLCAGASGAGFGLLGAMVALLLLKKDSARGFSLQRIVVYLALAIYIGVSKGGVDNAAHIGGLIAGIIVGFILIFTMKRKEFPYED